MERRLGRDPFAQSGLDKIFTPVVEHATTPASRPKPEKAKPRVKEKKEINTPSVSNVNVNDTANATTTAITNNDENITASSRGLPKGWTRATFIVRQDLLHRVKRVAYWDRKQIKDVVSEALDAYLIDKKTD